MVDQQLGQKQAADDPAWEHEGEFFNLWRDRYPDRPKPPKRSVPVTEDEFLTALYDPLVTFVKAREAFDPLAFVDVEKLHPRHPRWSPGWHWVVAGDKNDWWLEVLDERPRWAHHPYRLDPKGDQAFFAGIRGRHDLPSDVTEPGFLNYFCAELSELMGDERFGQEQALTAYRHGATTDNPPWVHTTNGI